MELMEPIPTRSGIVQRRHSIDASSDYADSDLVFSESLLASNGEGLVDNPLLHLNLDEVESLVRRFVRVYGLADQEELFIKVSRSRNMRKKWSTDIRQAGKILRDPESPESVLNLSNEEKTVLKKETISGFWTQPKALRVSENAVQLQADTADLSCRSQSLRCVSPLLYKAGTKTD